MDLSPGIRCLPRNLFGYIYVPVAHHARSMCHSRSWGSILGDRRLHSIPGHLGSTLTAIVINVIQIMSLIGGQHRVMSTAWSFVEGLRVRQRGKVVIPTAFMQGL